MSLKRKLIASDESDEDDSFEHRRSSLQVNLSYSTNLSDSGNGSLGRTVQVANVRETELQSDKGSSKKKGTHIKTNYKVNNDKSARVTTDTSKHAMNNSRASLRINDGIQLKHVTIKLEDIRAKKQILNASCQRLKDSILSKTKQISDKKDELSIRTTMVLQNCPTSNVHTLNADKSVFMLDATTNQHSEYKKSIECDRYNDTMNDQHFDIVTTLTNGSRRSIEKIMDRYQLTPKRLFTEQNKRDCKIIEDNILSKNLPILSLKEQMVQSGSPILSGSNRRLQLLRAHSKLPSHCQSENQNNIHSMIHLDHSSDIGSPVVCSTFIDDNVTKNESSCNEVNNDIDTSLTTRTTNKVISMEMTKAHGDIRLSELPSDRNLDIYKHIKNRKKENPKDQSSKRDENLISLRGLKNICAPANELNVQNDDERTNIHSDASSTANNQMSVYIETVVPAQATSIEKIVLAAETRDRGMQANERGNHTYKQSEKQRTHILSDSSNMTRSSLKVNTSLNVVTKTSVAKKAQGSDNYGVVIDRDSKTTNNEDLVTLCDRRKSTSNNHTSLQVNTSVDSICKIWLKKNTRFSKRYSVEDKNIENHVGTDDQCSSAVKNTETDDACPLEDISLFERLRDISAQVSHHKSKVSETRDKERIENIISKSLTSAKHRNGERKNNNSASGYSYVEATPYPVSRSVLFRSQLRHKTQNLDDNVASGSDNINSNKNKKNNDEANSNSSYLTPILRKTHASIGTSKIVSSSIDDDTIILGDTPNCNPFLTQEKLTVIEDTLNEIRLKINEENTIASQGAKCVPVRTGRKKLLSLNESSQYSITPLEEDKSKSEKPTSIKKNIKKLRKRCPKRKSASFKNDKSTINKRKRITSSDDDYDISKNKRSIKKKTRKPRKIVSKKIIIKKFADENVLNILKKSTQSEEKDWSLKNRNSSGDFVAHRIIPSQWNKYKPQRIIIVTTGLSKGDKSLVKSIVKSLGMAKLEQNVSRQTTHVVSTGVRTINLLRGIIRGCWLVTLEWVLKSLESNTWLNPEEFEMKHFSKAVLENRKDRQLFGASYIPELFTTCGFIHIGSKTTLPCDTLKELIKTAGGHTTENPKLAKITIGASGLKDTWILDSITTGELQSTELYQRK